MHQVTVLGATGSIGKSTLDVIARHPEQYQVYALTCHSDIDTLIAQAKICQPKHLVVAQSALYDSLKQQASSANLQCEIHAGPQALCDVASADDVTQVMAAIVGAAGLLPSFAAVKAGKQVLLANKEALVMSGELFIRAAADNNATILPIDSEHNAIFQCLPTSYRYADLKGAGISKILLTGSGGPFRDCPIEQLQNKTPEQACAHPNWSMGRKISVDSATMMNKGLEFIEACWLFGVKPADIDVVIHPQSVIHSMVQYKDGSVLAQMGNPDMRTPIAHAMAYPERIESGVAALDFAALTDFSFFRPDFARFPNLKLAIDAAAQAQFASTALNAANEIAVDAFLQGHIRFTDIADINRATLDLADEQSLTCIDSVIEYDGQIRRLALQAVKGAA